ELFTLTQADERERDVVGRETTQANQVLREIDDPHRLAHVQHEQLAALRQAAGLQHEIDRFRDRHEEALRVRMRHRDRPAALDLTLEFGDHTAAAAEYVTETN